MHYPVQAQHSNCREVKGVHLLSIYKLEDGCGHVGESAEEIIKNQNIKNKLREKLHGSDSICGGKRRGNVLGQDPEAGSHPYPIASTHVARPTDILQQFLLQITAFAVSNVPISSELHTFGYGESLDCPSLLPLEKRKLNGDFG